jgi:cytochrome c biogenesis protein CcdA
MEAHNLPIITALWLGMLTSISPCPLASNIAAVSFISRDITRAPSVLLQGGSYILGRMLCYGAFGIVISASLINIPAVSQLLQRYMPQVVGPLLVLTGIVVLGLVPIRFAGLVLSQESAQRLRGRGAWGALLLGALFALAFCPVSAAFFFGSLIPLAVSAQSPLLLPLAYGLGTGLPVLAFAIALCFGMKRVSALFRKMTALDRWMRLLMGTVLILVGLYYVGKYICFFDLP